MEISWINIWQNYKKHILWKYGPCWHSVVENNLGHKPVLNVCEPGSENSNAIHF